MGTITIVGTEHIKWAEDEKLFTETIARANHHAQHPQAQVTIFVTPRSIEGPNPQGWLEYGLRVYYGGGGGTYIGCIQRSVGAKCEFRS